MARHKLELDRGVRIELLRARSALEREALVKSVVQAADSLHPSAIFRSVWPGVTAKGGARTALRVFGLLRRYPMLASSLSALIMGKGRSGKILKIGGAVLLGYQIFKVWRGSDRRFGKDGIP